MDSSREDLGSWLDGGPRPSGEYPGQRLGLAEHGPGSLALENVALVGTIGSRAPCSCGPSSRPSTKVR